METDTTLSSRRTLSHFVLLGRVSLTFSQDSQSKLNTDLGLDLASSLDSGVDDDDDDDESLDFDYDFFHANESYRDNRHHTDALPATIASLYFGIPHLFPRFAGPRHVSIADLAHCVWQLVVVCRLLFSRRDDLVVLGD